MYQPSPQQIAMALQITQQQQQQQQQMQGGGLVDPAIVASGARPPSGGIPQDPAIMSASGFPPKVPAFPQPMGPRPGHQGGGGGDAMGLARMLQRANINVGNSTGPLPVPSRGGGSGGGMAAGMQGMQGMGGMMPGMGGMPMPMPMPMFNHAPPSAGQHAGAPSMGDPAIVTSGAPIPAPGVRGGLCVPVFLRYSLLCQKQRLRCSRSSCVETSFRARRKRASGGASGLCLWCPRWTWCRWLVCTCVCVSSACVQVE